MEGGVRRMRGSTATIRREKPREQMDASLPTPLYHQVYLVLRDKIISGAYGAEGLLPGEPGLAAQFGVSRITLKRALDDLPAAGFVRRHGRKDLASPPLLALLERSGVVAGSAEQTLGARLADPTVAAQLEVSV